MAVHKKKVSQVKDWLTASFQSNPFQKQFHKLLILSGPTGSGKTSTIQVLSKEMNFEIVEWINPINESSLSSIKQGMSSPFFPFETLPEGFLESKKKYEALLYDIRSSFKKK